jgi:hypothetical protein
MRKRRSDGDAGWSLEVRTDAAVRTALLGPLGQGELFSKTSSPPMAEKGHV